MEERCGAISRGMPSVLATPTTYNPVSDAAKFYVSQSHQKENIATAANQQALRKSVRNAVDIDRVVEELTRVQHEQDAAERANIEALKTSVRKSIECEQRRRAEAERRREQQKLEDARRAADKAAAKQVHEAKRLAHVVKEQAEQEVQANRDIVEEFLRDNGYDHVNCKRTRGSMYKFPLHTAVIQHKVEMVRRLLRCGANPALTNSAGKTPRQVAEAITRASPELADMLSALPAP